MPISEVVSKEAHLIQLHPFGAAELFRDFNTGQECWFPAVRRGLENFKLADTVFFWVTGQGDAAGLVGFGSATSHVAELEHPVTYNDPNGPTTMRPSPEVYLGYVRPEPVVTRSHLETQPEFADFGLFRMARRANPFPVTHEQAVILMGSFKRYFADGASD